MTKQENPITDTKTKRITRTKTPKKTITHEHINLWDATLSIMSITGLINTYPVTAKAIQALKYNTKHFTSAQWLDENGNLVDIYHAMTPFYKLCLNGLPKEKELCQSLESPVAESASKCV